MRTTTNILNGTVLDFRHGRRATKILDGVARALTPAVLVPVAMVGATLLRKREGAPTLALATLAAAGVAHVLKPIARRRRPHFFLLGSSPKRSFPSGHATVSTALLLGLARVAPPRAWPLSFAAATAAALAVGALRLRLGKHWPTDLLGGQAIALAAFAGAAAVERFALAGSGATPDR